MRSEEFDIINQISNFRKKNMSRIYNSLLQLTGATPLVKLSMIGGALNFNIAAGCSVLAKIESFNPAGSAKDRVALAMIEDAEAKGELKKGATIIEPTSGNTGVGLAFVSAIKGYKLVLTMPETMSVERRKLVAAYGAEVVLTPGQEGMRGAIDKANSLHNEIKGSVILQQFSNPANPRCHYLTTGPEIWKDTDGAVDIFVASIGTGGTVSGAGKYLKEKKSSVRVFGVEPSGSPILTKGVAGKHNIQGIGAGFVPDTLDKDVLDEVLTVTDGEAFSAARALAKNEGILSGISSGATVHAALTIASRQESKDKMIVVLLPDTGERYLSVL